MTNVEVTSINVIQICEAAYDNMIAELNILLQDIGNYPV